MPQTAAAAYERRLVARPPETWREFLREHSGLPGPRGNLELADAFSAVGDRHLILQLAESEDEYERFCGTQAVGRLLVDEPTEGAHLALLRERATDPRWRVREAAARALQILADHEPDRMGAIVEAWAVAPEPYVRRAAVAAICEPRLLKSPRLEAIALAACWNATSFIGELPVDARSAGDVRTLRQALGYCWSVAVAADPARGLPIFARLQESGDPDIQWVVSSNLKKARLQRVLQ